jgi:hypothetical protein
MRAPISDGRLAFLLIALTTLLLAVQLFYFIDRNSVNILFSDQWDLYQPIFRQANNWEVFFAQEGQLRLGLGGLFSKYIADFSDWNTRAESFSLGFLMILNTVSALFLKWRLFRKLTIWDTLIAFLFLGLPQLTSPITVPFPSHNLLPLFLVLNFGICLTVENHNLRLGLICVVNFVSLFTGWGIFVGFLTPIVLIVFAIKTASRNEKISTVLAFLVYLVSVFVFAYKYSFVSGIDCFEFPHLPLTDYWLFFAKLFSSTIALVCGRKDYLWEIFGSASVVLLLATAAWSCWRVFRARALEKQALVIFILCVFSFAFAAFSSVGRICAGVCMADGGRYQPLIIPAWLALIFSVNFLPRLFWQRATFSALLIGLFILPESRLKHYREELDAGTKAKIQWRDCYFANENADLCDETTNFSIYFPNKSKSVQDRIDFLKERKLNLFIESK